MQFYFRTGPPPYQTHFNLPAPFQTLPVAALQSQNWPVYPNQYRAALMSPDTYAMNRNVFFLPLPAVQHPYAGAIRAVDVVRTAQAQYAAFQRHALATYLGGYPLEPEQARAVLALKMPYPQDVVAQDALKMQRCPPPGGGARQVSFHPRAAPPLAVLRYMQAAARGDIINPASELSSRGVRLQNAANQMVHAVYEASGSRVLPNIQQPGVQMANNLTRAMVAPTRQQSAVSMANAGASVPATRFPLKTLPRPVTRVSASMQALPAPRTLAPVHAVSTSMRFK